MRYFMNFNETKKKTRAQWKANVALAQLYELELMMVLVKGQGVKNMRRLVNSVTLVNPFWYSLLTLSISALT